MKKLVAILAVSGMLAATACGPSEEERRIQDSLSEKHQDSASESMLDEAEQEMKTMDSLRKVDSAHKADSMKQDSMKKAADAKPKGK